MVFLQGPHTDASYEAYLRWYLPRTRRTVSYVQVEPQRHEASTQDTFPQHRTEALAGMVSYTTTIFHMCLTNVVSNIVYFVHAV